MGLSSLRLKGTQHGGHMGTHPRGKILILHRFMPRCLRNHHCISGLILWLEQCKQGVGKQEICPPPFLSHKVTFLLGWDVPLGASLLLRPLWCDQAITALLPLEESNLGTELGKNNKIFLVTCALGVTSCPTEMRWARSSFRVGAQPPRSTPGLVLQSWTAGGAPGGQF